MKRYTFIDKTNWDNGPWQQEIDAQYWIDEETFYPCFVRRNLFGAWVGYVGLDPNHPYYLSHAGSEEFEFIEVHNGPPTFADYMPEHSTEFSPPIRHWWIGFDCLHDDDFCPLFDMKKSNKTGRARRRRKGEPSVEQYRDFHYATLQVELLANYLGSSDMRLFE